MVERATATSWRTEPMPAQRAPMTVEGRIDQASYEQLSRGAVPESQDDKWFAYLDDDVLHLHRSWTGYEIFRVRFARDDAGEYAVAEAWVNRDPAQVDFTQELEEQILGQLLNTLATR